MEETVGERGRKVESLECTAENQTSISVELEGNGGQKCIARPHKRRILVYAAAALIAVKLLLATFLVGLYFYHPKMVYAPHKHIERSERFYTERYGEGTESIWITSKDNTRLHSFWMPALGTGEATKKHATLLYMHGNVGTLTQVLRHADCLQKSFATPTHVYIVSYRGYGLSDGAPQMAGIRSDAQAALDYLTDCRPEADQERLLLFGHSLGGAVALNLLASNPGRFHSAVIENTFQSIPKMASHAQPGLVWATFVVTETWDNEDQIRTISKWPPSARLPHVLFVIGDEDCRIPPSHSEALFSALSEVYSARGRQELVRRYRYPSMRHECWEHPSFFTDISAFFREAIADRPTLASAPTASPPARIATRQRKIVPISCAA